MPLYDIYAFGLKCAAVVAMIFIGLTDMKMGFEGNGFMRWYMIGQSLGWFLATYSIIKARIIP